MTPGCRRSSPCMAGILLQVVGLAMSLSVQLQCGCGYGGRSCAACFCSWCVCVGVFDLCAPCDDTAGMLSPAGLELR